MNSSPSWASIASAYGSSGKGMSGGIGSGDGVASPGVAVTMRCASSHVTNEPGASGAVGAPTHLAAAACRRPAIGRRRRSATCRRGRSEQQAIVIGLVVGAGSRACCIARCPRSIGHVGSWRTIPAAKLPMRTLHVPLPLSSPGPTYPRSSQLTRLGSSASRQQKSVGWLAVERFDVVDLRTCAPERVAGMRPIAALIADGSAADHQRAVVVTEVGVRVGDEQPIAAAVHHRARRIRDGVGERRTPAWFRPHAGR